MEPFYRATLRLERVEPYTDGNYPRERTAELAAHTTTGDTPADAMHQLCDHADSLRNWHIELADNEPDADRAEVVNLPADHPLAQALSNLGKKLFGPAAPAETNPGSQDDTGEPQMPANPFDHCHAFVGVGWCHRRKGHDGECSTSSKADETHTAEFEPGQEGAEAENDPAFRNEPDDQPTGGIPVTIQPGPALAANPEPTAWCGDPDHDDPCNNCDAVLADASDALRQRIPGGQ